MLECFREILKSCLSSCRSCVGYLEDNVSHNMSLLQEEERSSNLLSKRPGQVAVGASNRDDASADDDEDADEDP